MSCLGVQWKEITCHGDPDRPCFSESSIFFDAGRLTEADPSERLCVIVGCDELGRVIFLPVQKIVFFHAAAHEIPFDGIPFMAGFDHATPHPREVEDQAIATRNSRYGMVLFLFYLSIYAVFVILNAFRPEIMDLTPMWGLSLAVSYGFSLIVIAMVLSLIYCWLCRGRGSGNSLHT